MQLSVTGKQLDVGDALRAHIEQNLSTAIGKYFANPTDANVVLSREARNIRADIKVHVGRGIILQGHADASDAYAAFDLASEHIAKRLRRHKRRLRSHQRNKADTEKALRAQQYVLAPLQEEEVVVAAEGSESADGQPVIIADMETRIDTLTVGEAVMRMDLANLPAMMFRNRAHGGLNMIHVRQDGNIGWIDPRGNRGKPASGS
jgi:ribosomal subunit interface protein